MFLQEHIAAKTERPDYPYLLLQLRRTNPRHQRFGLDVPSGTLDRSVEWEFQSRRRLTFNLVRVVQRHLLQDWVRAIQQLRHAEMFLQEHPVRSHILPAIQ